MEGGWGGGGVKDEGRIEWQSKKRQINRRKGALKKSKGQEGEGKKRRNGRS